MTPRQTISYLQRRFSEAGIHPDTRHGQNFLVDLNLVDILARSADITNDDVVLEVGTGTGSLTTILAHESDTVVTVEVNRALQQLAREELDGVTNVVFLHADALKNKNRLNPVVLDTVSGLLEEDDRRRFKLVANLPYNIATPVISNLLSAPVIPDLMVVTIQKELADRITASPGVKDYSALSIWVQCQCRTEVIRVLPPTVFWPRPKVHSAILRIEPVPEWRAALPDPAFFHEFVRSLFLHRRKVLRRVLASRFRDRWEKPEIDGVLKDHGLPLDARAEQLSIPQLVALSESFRDHPEGDADGITGDERTA